MLCQPPVRLESANSSLLAVCGVLQLVWLPWRGAIQPKLRLSFIRALRTGSSASDYGDAVTRLAGGSCQGKEGARSVLGRLMSARNQPWRKTSLQPTVSLT